MENFGTPSDKNRMNHVLNLQHPDTQKKLDEIFLFITAYYKENWLIPKVFNIYDVDNRYDFAALTENKAEAYFKYGFSLVMSGVGPFIRKVLMQEVFDIIVNNSTKDELDTLRIQLLFVKETIALIEEMGSIDGYKEFLSLSQELVSLKGLTEFHLEQKYI